MKANAASYKTQTKEPIVEQQLLETRVNVVLSATATLDRFAGLKQVVGSRSADL
jgi:hypothetical protein